MSSISSDSEDQLEEGNVMKTGSRPLYSLKETLKKGQNVLTQDQHIITIFANCLKHSCSMEQVKDVLDLVKLNCPTPNNCETFVDKVISLALHFAGGDLHIDKKI